jgi:phosphatidylinositol alpha-1,6-mannosyltransferase
MILILTQCFPPDRGGIETLMGGLADHLRENGDEVLVFADRVRTSSTAGIQPPYPVRRFGGWRPLRRRLKAFAVGQAVKALPITGIFADSWKSVELLPPLDLPVIVLAHGMEFPQRPSASKRARIVSAFRRADHIIANSAFTAGLAQDYVENKDKISVLNPPISSQPSSTAQARAWVADLLDGGGPVILTLSRLEPRKGIDAVIRALPVLLEREMGLVYVVAGGGDDRLRLEALAAELGVQSHVRFTGPVDDATKAALYEDATIFAMPVRREGNSVEGFGLTYIEAGWHGVPALAGREGGAPDAVIDDVTGLVCNGDDPADVLAKLSLLLGDPQLRARLGQAARTHARGAMQWANAIQRYRGQLTRCARDRARRGG